MLISLLIAVLIVIGIFLILRLAIQYMLPPGSIQETVILIIGIIGVILILVEIGAAIGGRQGMFGGAFR